MTVIFMITIAALLLSGMASMLLLGQKQTALSFYSSRAMQAAESGIQLELSKMIHPQGGGGCKTASTSTTTYTFGTGGLKGCKATTTCNVSTIKSEDYASIESIGRCGDATGSLDSASRKIRVRAKRPQTP